MRIVETAKVTSKGQVTIPKAVRESLGVAAGDQLSFEVEDGGVLVRAVPDFIELAGSVPLPPRLEGLSDQELLEGEKEAARRGWTERGGQARHR
jgi:AbrB family looped-hinge helix DNA binding protein